MNKENAIKACRQGAIAGVFVCISNLAIFLVAKFGNHSEGFLGYFNDNLVLIDCALILFLSFGIYKCSRINAFTMVILYFFSQVTLYFKGFSVGPVLNITSLIVSLLVFLLFVNAARGSSFIHRIEISENPNPKPDPNPNLVSLHGTQSQNLIHPIPKPNPSRPKS